MWRLWLLAAAAAVALGGSTAVARDVLLDGRVAFHDAGVAMYRLATPATPSNVSARAVVAAPLHGCWVDDAQRVVGRAVWLANIQPLEWSLQCTLQQRVVAQQEAGAAFVVMSLGSPWPTQPQEMPVVFFGWGTGVHVDAVLVSDAFFLNVTRLLANASLMTTTLTPPTERDAARALYYWRLHVGYVAGFACVYFFTALMCAFVSLRRFTSLKTQVSLRKRLSSDVAFYVLALGVLTSLWKCGCATIGAFNRLFPALSWPAYVWLSDVGDILLYNMLALFIYSWSNMLARIDASRNPSARYNVFHVPTIVFIMAYSILSVFSLAFETRYVEGLYVRLATLLGAIVYLLVVYIYVGARLVALLSRAARNSDTVSPVIVAGITTVCVVLVVVLVLNGALLILLVAQPTAASLTTTILSSAADAALLLNTSLFYVHTLYQQLRLQNSSALATTMPLTPSDRSAPVSPRGGGSASRRRSENRRARQAEREAEREAAARRAKVAAVGGGGLNLGGVAATPERRAASPLSDRELHDISLDDDNNGSSTFSFNLPT